MAIAGSSYPREWPTGQLELVRQQASSGCSGCGAVQSTGTQQRYGWPFVENLFESFDFRPPRTSEGHKGKEMQGKERKYFLWTVGADEE